MVPAMNWIFRRYGSLLQVRRGNKILQLRGFLHLFTSRSWQNMEREYLPLGEIPLGQYILVVPASSGLIPGDQVERDGKAYVLRRSELMYHRDKPLYLWGLCVEKGVVDKSN